MKRIFVTLSGLVLALALVSCQSGKKESAGTAVAAPAPAPETPLNMRLQNTYGWKGGRALPDGVRNYQPPEDRAVQSAAGPVETYTVVKGDTLWSIALRKYGDGKKWETLLNANSNTLNGNPELKVGMVLVIPPAPAK